MTVVNHRYRPFLHWSSFLKLQSLATYEPSHTNPSYSSSKALKCYLSFPYFDDLKVGLLRAIEVSTGLLTKVEDRQSVDVVVVDHCLGLDLALAGFPDFKV